VALSIRHRVEDFKSSLARLSPRERAALWGLGAAVGLVIVFGVGYVIASGLEEIEQKNRDTLKALADLRTFGPRYMTERRRLAALEVRMGRSPLELNSFVEEKAKAVGVKISESDEITPVTGDRYVQRGLEIKLRRIKMDELAKLLKALENSPHLVQVTRLSVVTRWSEERELDVEMVVSTYERRPPGQKKAGGRRRGRRGRDRT